MTPERRMNIALLCPRYLWAGGGSIVHAKRLAEELQALGHSVRLFTDASDQADPNLLTEACVPVTTLERNPEIEQRAARRLAWDRKPGFYRLCTYLHRSGRQQLTASGPWCPAVADPATFSGFDLVVLLNAASAWSLLFGQLLRRNPPFATVVMPLFHVREASGSWPIHRRLFAAADRINTSTDFETNWLRSRGWPATKLHAIGPGADPSPLTPDPDAFRKEHRIPAEVPIVLFLGRKVWNKGVVHVIGAMDLVWKNQPDAVLVLIGFAHNDRAWLHSYIRVAKGLVVNLDDAGEQTREDALAACTLMAAPSISDSFGIVYLDAWRHAKPVIACRDTACESIVSDGGNGYLVDFGDVPMIGQCILDLLRLSEEAQRMGRAGQELWKRRYTWPEIARRTEALYRTILEERA